MDREEAKRKLSFRDIAVEAGVSVSTVSRVLSGVKNNAKISDNTRQRILEICEEKRFRPNIHYKRLHEGLSRVIAFLIPPPSPNMVFFDETVGNFLSALEPCLAHHGFHIMIQSTTPEFLSSKKYLEIFRSHTVDGALLWDVCRDDDHLKIIMQEQKPLLKVAFSSKHLQDQIVPDNYQGSYDLTRHLLELGHVHIAYISGGFSQVDNDRMRGYEDALATVGARPTTFPGKYTYDSGLSWTEKIIKTEPAVTAIMAANDLMAAGCLRKIKELGLTCPGDYSVTGFDCTSHSEITDPRITTADLRLDKIGRLAADRIVKAVLKPEEYEPRITKIAMPLILRESTGPTRTIPKPKPRRRKDD